MAKDYEEKRSFPRIKADLKVDIPKSIHATLMDLSENGISINSSEMISSPNISLRVHFPDTDLKMEAKLVWRRNLKTGGSSYGMEFVGLTENQKSEIRKELIKTEISGLLNEINPSEVREQISCFFLKDVLGYISEIIKLISIQSRHREYSLELQKEFDRLTTKILLKGYCLEELLIDRKIMQKVKDRFRQLIGTWIYKSMIVKRAYEKPRGYPGDYKMLEIVYDNKPISKNFGVYPDNCLLKSPYAVAVRIRKDRLKELLLDFINSSKLSKINILNIACGSCREINESLPDIKTHSSIIFNCLDWDEEALQFSQDVLLPNMPENVEFKFIKEDIINIIKDEDVAQSLGVQNLIYSIGLIDYLPDRILKRLINALYRFLPRGGKLVLTHKNKEKTFPTIPPDWFCDWKFVPRNKEEIINLFYDCGVSKFTLSSDSDDFEYIYYFTITKL